MAGHLQRHRLEARVHGLGITGWFIDDGDWYSVMVDLQV
jgi:hypothetical protein